MRRLTWNLRGRDRSDISITDPGGVPASRAWAWGGATGAGVRTCIVDSGVESGHPLVGPVAGAYAVTAGPGGMQVVARDPVDRFGHGTACASIVRRIASDCEIYSVQVLGDTGGCSGEALATGLRWAVEEGFDVINLSLSTTRPQYAQVLREIVDDAYFDRTVVVASARTAAVESFPWRFGAVVSVGSHQEPDPELILYNPNPPVEFFAMGQGVPVAGLGGTTTRNTGNSFATPHVAARCALILSKHPGLTPFQIKDILFLTADNVRGPDVDN